eukprot:TRINITY_DN64798_c0_g1_i1.p1 TRINITY_DN64798_c0_g1~~TRINITY_DN64798_c0_g1_i1.p1  ORF type:complete len:245 (+),score=50.36 TRINITY_DN64798_c0_g1_i1:35-769(+)
MAKSFLLNASSLVVRDPAGDPYGDGQTVLLREPDIVEGASDDERHIVVRFEFCDVPTIVYSWRFGNHGARVEIPASALTSFRAFSAGTTKKTKAVLEFAPSMKPVVDLSTPGLTCTAEAQIVANLAMNVALHEAFRTSQMHTIIFEHRREEVKKSLRGFADEIAGLRRRIATPVVEKKRPRQEQAKPEVGVGATKVQEEKKQKTTREEEEEEEVFASYQLPRANTDEAAVVTSDCVAEVLQLVN